MARLITFGCSYTYGQSLPDCVNMPITDLISFTPSQLGWPKLVADKLGVELISQGVPY